MTTVIHINSFQTPNIYIDEIMQHLTPSEFMCLTFIIRHTVGWRWRIHERKARMSLSMFEHGFIVEKGGETTQYGGTGLSRKTIITALRGLEALGLISRADKENPDGQYVHLVDTIDLALVNSIGEARSKANAKRGYNSHKNRIVIEDSDEESATDEEGSNEGLRCKNSPDSGGEIKPNRNTYKDISIKDSESLHDSGRMVSIFGDADDGEPLEIRAAKPKAKTPTVDDVADADALPNNTPKVASPKRVTPKTANKPSAPKKPRERDPIWDAVQWHVFGISLDTPNVEGGRIAGIVAWLKGQEGKVAKEYGLLHELATVEDIERFANVFKARNHTPPQGYPQFTEKWRAYLSWRDGQGDDAAKSTAVIQYEEEERRLRELKAREVYGIGG